MTAHPFATAHPFPDSGRSQLFVSREGIIVDEVIDKNSRNGKWFFCVHVDMESRFGSLWNIVEERWAVAESEWSVICTNGSSLVFTPGDECDRMYGSLLSFRQVDVELDAEGITRINEECDDLKVLSSAPTCVLLRCSRSASVKKMIDVIEVVARQYKFVVKVFVKPIDLPAHGESPVPWLKSYEKDSGRISVPSSSPCPTTTWAGAALITPGASSTTFERWC